MDSAFPPPVHAASRRRRTIERYANRLFDMSILLIVGPFAGGILSVVNDLVAIAGVVAGCSLLVGIFVGVFVAKKTNIWIMLKRSRPSR
jgi:hypothetical protein